MNARTLTVLVAVVAVVGLTGASAFTSATVERDAQIEVQNDDAGVIKLNDGTAQGASITSGTLTIEGDDSEALNREALFRFGDNSTPGDAQTTHAFNVTNNDDIAHDFTFDLASTSGVTIELYDGTNSVGTVTNGGSATTSVASGSTLYAVIIVDTDTTTGINAIDGTLTITAN